MSHSPITLAYDLYSLPSTQHRAGLTGLCFVCDAMRQSGRFQSEALPDIQYYEDTGLYQFTWTPESLTAVLNYLYAATLEEVEVKQKWQSAELLRTVTKPNKDGKEERWFVHQQVTPSVVEAALV
jgi:CRISPR-associated protein Cmx8